ncbi:probable trehalase isoform X3 [Phoenix dactylifera]|uniref:alpha,alpha-trehalase n=1 Tax=Phoenix dactylifera TaxID=42345 RepID=A0A8B9A3J1_PHODC|nr:probable trehalase isoform X3 [Phoenix dactylifera]
MVRPTTPEHASNTKVSSSLLLLLPLLLFPSFAMSVSAAPCGDASAPVKPTTPLLSFLQRLQSAAFATLGPDGFDPKLYVDVPFKTDLAATEEAFARLPRPGGVIPVSNLERFLGDYFGEAGSDLVHAEPSDFVVEPEGFLPKVENPKVRAWALEVHSLWKNLSRRVSDEVRERPEQHTLLPLPWPGVVPGSRFREVYYWDSYWSIRGLLASKMYDTAKSIVNNLISLIEIYGYVLNGARTYYSNRSNSSDLTTLATTSIIPVDLNAFIYKMELDIAFFAKLIGDNSTSEKFLAASKARQAAIRSIFWNSEMEQWLDYWLISKSNCEEVYQWEAHYQNRNIFASNFIPLWIETYNTDLCKDGTMVEKVLKSLQSSGLLHVAGIATSLSNTGEQWDFPNGWAPLQHMIVEGLTKSGSKEAKSVAEDIAIRWIRTNYAAYMKTGAMHEKYDVEACGKIGGGGEYKPQTGFGWSNGVVLAFLEEFGWPRDREIECQ